MATRAAAPTRFDRYNQLDGLTPTPELVVSILRDADDGYLTRLDDLMTVMQERDSRLAGEIRARKNAVLGLDWHIMPAGEEARDEEIAEFVREVLNGIEDWEEDLGDLLEGVFRPLAAAELEWEIVDGRATLAGLWRVPMKRFRWTIEGLELLESPYKVHGEPVDSPELQDRLVLFSARSRSGFLPRMGILRELVKPWILKDFAVKDWSVFLEKFGIPFALGEYENPEQAEDLLEALSKFGADGFGAVPSGVQVNLVEAAKGSVDAHKQLTDWVDQQYSIAIRGHSAASESTPGRLGGDDIAAAVRGDLIRSDARAIENVVNSQIIRRLVGFNFEGADPPRYVIDTSEPVNRVQEAEIVGRLLEAGVALPAMEVYERTGYKPPEEGEDVVEPMQRGIPAVASTADREAAGILGDVVRSWSTGKRS